MKKVSSMLLFLFLTSIAPVYTQISPNTPIESIQFVSIPAGSFMRGSSESEQGGKDDEKPQHLVKVESFEIMTTEVTQKMWQEVMGLSIDNQIETKTGGKSLYKTKGDNIPVYYVSWYGANEFIEKLNHLDPSYHYSLPSEARWEYACRAGSTTRFYWGNDINNEHITDFAWITENNNSEKFINAHPVGQKKPNDWEIFDMAGNLLEWCQDSYFDNYKKASEMGDPLLVDTNNEKVARGSNCGVPGKYCRSANRFHFVADFNNYNIGFRVARVKK